MQYLKWESFDIGIAIRIGELKENGTTHKNSTVSSNKIIGKEISALVNQCMFFCN